MYKRQDLDDKTEEFIVNNNCITLNKDPTNKYQTQITNILENSTQIINPKHSFKYKIGNPCAPKLNSLIKLHKINKPITPLINARTCLLYTSRCV